MADVVFTPGITVGSTPKVYISYSLKGLTVTKDTKQMSLGMIMMLTHKSSRASEKYTRSGNNQVSKGFREITQLFEYAAAARLAARIGRFPTVLKESQVCLRMNNVSTTRRTNIMKSFTRFFVAALIVTAVVAMTPNSAFAQASATATANANANIIAPITIVQTADLNFGDLVPTAAAGTATVSTAGARVVAGGVSAAGGAVNAAAFTVGGDTGRAFTVTLPANGTVTIDDAGVGVAMGVNNFTSACAGGCTIGAAGTTLSVGGQLSVGASQVAGAYTGTFDVTVAY